MNLSSSHPKLRDMSATGTRKRSKTYEVRSNSKSRRLEKQGSYWSNLLRDILELIIERLHWADKFHIRAVCKSWSFPNLHIPTIDRLPWAMTKFCWRRTRDGKIYREFSLLDPYSRAYVVKELVREKEFGVFRSGRPLASAYGWVLFEVVKAPRRLLFLYSPFTTEVIKLPELEEAFEFQVATFSLNAMSPKCVIFLLDVDRVDRKLCVKLCSAGDYSWKNFEIDCGLNELNEAVGAVYANGVFYCVFEGGQLGAFNIKLEEWTMLAGRYFTSIYRAKFFVSDGDLHLWEDGIGYILYKFDFSMMRWFEVYNLYNHVLFIGCTSFSARAVGETSRLAHTTFQFYRPYHQVRCHGTTPPSGIESLLYRKCLEAAKWAITWIEVPSGAIWRANDLINALMIS